MVIFTGRKVKRLGAGQDEYIDASDFGDGVDVRCCYHNGWRKSRNQEVIPIIIRLKF
jgi:hypothetical protein